VSDLLGRLAARAVGAPALAQPRLPVSPAGAAAGRIEVVDEQVVVPGTPPRALAQPPGEPGRAGPHRVLEATPVPGAAGEATPSIGITVPPPAPAAEAPRRARPVAAPEPVSAVPATDAEPDAPPAEPRTAGVAVTAVPATPAVPVPAAPAGPPAPAAAAAARDEPPPVHVHIGRLEVRASLEEAPRPQPLTAPRQPDGLSLSDYLRGRRDA